MFIWPELKLTEYEKQFVGIYGEPESRSGSRRFTGVLRRAYRLQLASKAQRDKNIPSIRLIDQIQISRRARIFAITFSGNTDCWRLSVRNTNGTQYVNPSPRGQKFPVVSSLVAGSYYNALALGGRVSPIPLLHKSQQTEAMGPNAGIAPGAALTGTSDFTSPPQQVLQGMQSSPWLIEPNWVCQPNETLIFQGEDISPEYATAIDANGVTTSHKFPIVLNIAVFAWEFPGMGA